MTLAITTRAVLLAGIALLPTTAYAQSEAPAPAAAPEAATEPDSADIVVTGSRIQRPDYASPNPIVSLDAQNLQRSGNTNVTDFLLRVPALSNSRDGTRTAGKDQPEGGQGGVGLDLLDLRALGPERTLVLVNGRRHVASQTGSAAVDINVIPTDLIQRVDVLTGSASAVYGADGVSGVVNFVLQRDFDGIKARAQMGISEEGDAGNRFASITAGHNFADGAGNITLAYEYNATDPLANDDRDFLRQENRLNFVRLNGFTPNTPGSYRFGPVADLRYGYSSPEGLVYIGNQIFLGNGRIYTPGTPIDDFTTGGDDSPVAGYIGDIFPRNRRHAVNLLSHYDFSEAFKVSLEGKFVQTTSTSLGSYSGSYPNRYSLDNPFIPLAIRNAAIANGDTTVEVYRNNFDLPRRGEEDRRRTYRGVIDVSGRVSDHATYDVYYTFGRTDVRATKLNNRLNVEFRQALDGISDGNGGVICRSAAARAAGCLPLNSFGNGTANPAAFDYFLANPDNYTRLDQHVVNASLTGDFGQLFALPGGPVQFAVGSEYRRESSDYQPADGYGFNNLFFQYDDYIVPNAAKGKFDVWEAFGEINVPILKDQPFAEILSVGAAGRYSDYSTIGSTRTYSFNGVWAPVRAITFRGSYGESVRAPNIGELFRPLTGTSNRFDDPCYIENQREPGASSTRVANCTALITAAGGTPATFTRNNNENRFIDIPGAVQGNTALEPETARTWTAGVVLKPDFIPGLQIALDWYDIKLKGAINTPDANTVARLCADSPTIDNALCAAIDRRTTTDPTGPNQRGYISGFRVQPQNVASFQTAGLELNASYRVGLSAGNSLDLRLVGGYLDKLTQIALPGAAVEDNRDTPFRPKYNVTFSPTLNTETVTLAYNLRWQNGVRRFSRAATDGQVNYVDPRYFRFKELWQHDIQAEFRVADQFAFYTGVNNVGNQKPDIGFQTNVPISPLGRFFYAGARVNFGR